VDGLDADFGSSLAYRLFGILVPGEEHRVPVHAHVDLRPGFDEHSVQIRLEMRSTEGLYLVEFAENGKPFEEKFAEIETSLKEATGVIA
jgi:hypothetical protein